MSRMPPISNVFVERRPKTSNELKRWRRRSRPASLKPRLWRARHTSPCCRDELMLPTSFQRAHDAGIERPRSRVVTLVFVQHDRAVFQVDVTPAELNRFRRAHALASEEAPQQAVRERY